MKKAITLIKQIDGLADQLIENYTIEEVNKAFDDYCKRYKKDGLNYITQTIYIPDD